MFVVFGLAASPLFGIEAAAIPHAAQAGDLAGFEGWQAAAEGFAPLLLPMLLGFVLIGVAIWRAPSPALPRWLGAVAAALAVVTAGAAAASASGRESLDLLQNTLSGYYVFVAWLGVLLWRADAGDTAG